MQEVPDKSFLEISNEDRDKDQLYQNGIEAFLRYSDTNPKRLSSGEIYCPCNNCQNNFKHHKVIVRYHLTANGFDANYKFWSYHGEGVVTEDILQAEPCIVHADHNANGMSDMLEDMLAPPYATDTFSEGAHFSSDIDRLIKLVKDNESYLYEGCEFTRLSFLIRLLHIQTLSGMTITHFEMLLVYVKKGNLRRRE